MLAFLLTLLDNDSDRELLSDVYREYKQYLLAVAVGSLSDESYIDDCIQNTFVELIGSFDRFKSVATDKRLSYISTICRRSAYKLNSENSKELPVEDLAGEEIPDTDEFDFSAFDKVDMACVINQLDEKYREPIVMKYMSGLSSAEISEALGISRNLVLQRIYRGKDLLYKLLTEE